MGTMRTIILLAFFLACGILLVILSCALYGNWWPLFVVLTYVLAPLPNMICRRCAGADDMFGDGETRGLLETGYFITAIFVVSGFGLPLVLAHAQVITVPAMLLSFFGGLLVYATILGYTHNFAQPVEGY
ncbi:vacuolar protein sorting 55 [Gonapodya prolifera JEL478]|uniref:Vacuolar protein sorting 55 n=1 Tax=Gonapodya prolifera (strain JEL478) TaxID=1344416 RepID=A0A139AMQ9_GONPJ|nr:vacuolar protein sorting 55 [Gonapodya prolifera JEL478]|eukprot:KXS17823.1 vacuolar protein sorting 55 [Gonapodya prolifera JEL478]